MQPVGSAPLAFFVIALMLDLGFRLHQNTAAVAVAVFVRRSNVAAFATAAVAVAVGWLFKKKAHIRTVRSNPFFAWLKQA